MCQTGLGEHFGFGWFFRYINKMMTSGYLTNVKRGWIRYLESIERTLLENVQRQKDKVVANVQEEMLETKLIEEQIIKQKDTFEFVEKHGSDKQAFLLTFATTLSFCLCTFSNKVLSIDSK
jgi:hypothetical protein